MSDPKQLAVVTGAASGIGRATASALAAQGARLIVADINAEAGERAAAELRAAGHEAEFLAVDLTDAASIAAFADAVQRKHGAVDVLVNAAGFVHAGSVLECSEEDWSFAFDLNVRSQFRTIKAFVPGMLERGSGSIINLASVAGSIKGAPTRFVYGSTQAAVIGLTKAVAADFITRGVRCNAICPGTVESPSLRDRIAAQAKASGQTTAQVEAAFIARQPMGRLGRVEEIAALAVYLASDESSFTTGTAQIIDGGWSN